MSEAFYQVKAERGLLGLYKGLGLTAFRGYYVNLIVLPLYEYVKMVLSNR